MRRYTVYEKHEYGHESYGLDWRRTPPMPRDTIILIPYVHCPLATSYKCRLVEIYFPGIRRRRTLSCRAMAACYYRCRFHYHTEGRRGLRERTGSSLARSTIDDFLDPHRERERGACRKQCWQPFAILNIVRLPKPAVGFQVYLSASAVVNESQWQEVQYLKVPGVPTNM